MQLSISFSRYLLHIVNNFHQFHSNILFSNYIALLFTIISEQASSPFFLQATELFQYYHTSHSYSLKSWSQYNENTKATKGIPQTDINLNLQQTHTYSLIKCLIQASAMKLLTISSILMRMIHFFIVSTKYFWCLMS